MTTKFINKIINANGKIVRHGKYSYSLNVWTGDIQRCLTGNESREWIDHDGRIHGAWETVAHA